MVGDNDIKIIVKFSGRLIPITISPDATVQRLKTIFLPDANVLARGQKLIFKVTLREAEVTNGAKLMLVDTRGLHKVDGSILKEANTRIISRSNDGVNAVKEVPVGKNCVECWQGAGVLTLAECNLKTLFLHAKGLSDESINWQRLVVFNHLKVLSISQN